ncbi:MAG: peptidase M4 family protein [Chloroflexi bacterium]|nr:peptidase M4 family protein [Chloroflexota bacterium]
MKRSLLIVLGLIVMTIGLSVLPANAQPPRQAVPHDARPALDRLRREHGAIDMLLNPELNTPAYLTGELARGADRDPLAATLAFFSRYGDAWGIGDPQQALRLIAREADALGYTSLRFEQQIAGYPVLDSDLRVHIDREGVLQTINGRLLPNTALPALRPRITRDAAITRARQQIGGQLQAEPRLGLLRLNDRDHLAWELWLLDLQQPARWGVRLDALDGTLLDRIDVLASARDRRTFDAAQMTFVPGTLARSEQTPPVEDDVVNAAHDHAGTVYDYFYSSFGRDSIDGAGMPITSTVHFAEGYNNALWVNDQMIYGDGDAAMFAPLAYALDVVAHELTHGITERTARLYYSLEPGALNESFSDIFGMLIDSANWDIGEVIYTPDIPGDTLRSAVDPTRYGDPAVWGEYLRTLVSNDNGAIHSNSGILNHTAYEIGSTIGRAKTAQIFYRTLTQKLTADSNFVVTRNLTIQSCQELIGTAGITPRDCEDVRAAFIRSGIGQSSAAAQPSTAKYRVRLPMVIQRSTGLSSRLPLPELPRCGTELVRNGNFEQGHVAWPTDSPNLVVVGGPSMTDGTQSARLTIGYQVLQWLRLPPGATTATFRFSLYRAGPEAPEDQETFYVYTETADGTTRDELLTLTAAEPINEWLSYTKTLDVRDIRDIRLIFRNRYGFQHIDNVSLIAECGS